MRTSMALLALLLLAVPAFAVDDAEKDLRPGLKHGAFDTPSPAQSPASGGQDSGRPAIPPGTALFAVVAAIAVLLVVCYPSRREFR